MMCENLFCIYWENGECVLDEVTLDCQGKCNECIYIKLDEKEIKAKSAQQRLSS